MSGTKKFAEAIKSDSSTTESDSLIGQFGVGFYSAFLVADKVTIESKAMDSDKVLRWESNAYDGYTISDVTDEADVKKNFAAISGPGGSGTRLTLHLKDDAEEFLDADKIVELVTKYSEFVQFPISVFNSKTTYDRVVDEVETKKKVEEIMKEKELEFDAARAELKVSEECEATATASASD